VVLGHGAGGSSWSTDLEALTSLTDHGWEVVLVEQPWRVAGRKVATPPAQLDVAWSAVMAELTSGRGKLPRPWVVGGRSAGARVACRTAAAVRADAVLALAFPLHPPGRPDKTRASEACLVLEAGIRLAVIQGERDPFGSPQELRDALGACPAGSLAGTPAGSLAGTPAGSMAGQLAGRLAGRAEVVAARGTHSFTSTPTDVLKAAAAFLADLPGIS
jgi:predicted alpha/beta-hydrolase family hydrolase